MKINYIVSTLLFAFASIVAISPAYAWPDEADRATIPFDFYAGNLKLPAGTYTIGLDLDTNVISLRDESGRLVKYLMGIPTESTTEDKPELLFVHSGDTYVLQEWKSNLEDVSFHSKMLEQILANRVEPTSVEVALNR